MSANLTAQRVFVHGLKVMAEIGLNPDERGRKQPLVINVTLVLPAAAPRHLHDTFNYEHVANAATALAEGGHIELAETFALRLAEAMMAHEIVQAATVSVGKPEALKAADLAGAEITLSKT